MAKETILVVDDEKDILELIQYNLEREGYAVATVSTGEAALRHVERGTPDLVLLDLMLPGVDGLEVCRRLRQDPRTRSLPIIMLTAKAEDTDIVTGLEVGADDYVTKPFSPKVLIARIRTLLRKSRGGSKDQSTETISVHGITIDISRHQVSVDGAQADLSATEFAVLELLARNPGRVYSRASIIDAVKGSDYPVTERSVDVQILGLRRKLGIKGAVVQTVRGVGYRMQAD